MTKLAGRHALVTGAASGIGLAISRRFAAEGAALTMADVAEEQGRAAADNIRQQGGKARFVHCDVGDLGALESIVEQAALFSGEIDILASCVGITGPQQGFLDSRVADFEQVLRVNLTASYLLGRLVTGRLAAAGKPGSIVFISSVGALLGVPNTFAYCVSKAGLEMLVKTMAITLADKGIRVNAIGPGPTETPMTATLAPEMRRKMLTRTPMGRFARPEEIAAIAAFLASDESSYVTGQTLYADGGRLALNYFVDPPAEA
jgi:NAD(P)-dependent dehydrogenase (short-subunit alcohol dehydrogenase family)